MPTLPNIGLITPVQGADRGTWDDKINAAFALVDAHDHTSGKGVQIVSAAININADLGWGGFGITALGKISFSAIAAPSGGSKNLFVSSADNELYWRTNAGVNVKLTNGASINTTLVGGIVGDYSTVGAEVAFVDADQVYTFKDQSSPTKKWARIASGPVRIYENDTTESVYVEHAVAAALAAPYTVTWPAALPASTKLMQISSTGVVTFANTTVTMEADQNIVLSGTGAIKHGDYLIDIPAVYPNLVDESGAGSSNNGANAGITVAVSAVTYIPLYGIPSGKRIKSISVRLGATPGASVDYRLAIFNASGGSEGFTGVGATTSSSASIPVVTPNGATGWPLGAGDTPFLKVTTPGGTTCVVCINSVTYFEN